MQYRLKRNVHVCAVPFNKECTRVCSIVVVRQDDDAVQWTVKQPDDRRHSDRPALSSRA